MILIPKTYLFLDKLFEKKPENREKTEFEFLPRNTWLKIIMNKNRSIYDLNIVWLLSKGYSVHDKEELGLPTIFEEDLKNIYFIDNDQDVWRCDCKINPIHSTSGVSDPCPECGKSFFDSNPDSLNYVEDLWKRKEFPIFYNDETKAFHDKDGVQITPDYIHKMNEFDPDRSVIYRFPPITILGMIKHTWKKTIFSVLKPITREEIEIHASDPGKVFRL